MRNFQLLTCVLLASLSVACGDKDEDGDGDGSGAECGTFLDCCGQVCVYQYETAEDCDPDDLDQFLEDCQELCPAFDLVLSAECKSVWADGYACQMDNEVLYQCWEGASAPISSGEGCEAELEAAANCTQ